jgi:hypothetical protein
VKYDINACVTALHTKRHKDDEPFYPYLRALLSFDTQVIIFQHHSLTCSIVLALSFKGLLNVISIAFEEAEFNTELGRCQKQRLVDILLKVILQNSKRK